MTVRLLGAAMAASFLFLSCVESPVDTDDEIEPQGDPSHSLRLVKPNGGEVYHVGDTIELRAKADTAYLQIMFELIVDTTPQERTSDLLIRHGDYLTLETGAVTYRAVIPDSIMYRGPFDPVQGRPDSYMVATQSTTCRVKVYLYDEPWIYDKSDAWFTILPRR